MSKLKRFAVVGSRDMNNYYIVYTYLKQYLPKDAVIVTGGARGVDTLAEVYGNLNGHPVEVYEAEWDRFGKAAGMVRNAEMARNIDHCIAFWDGKSPGTKEMIDLVNKKGIKPTIIDVCEADYIKPHPGRVVHVNKEEFDVYIGRPYKQYGGTLGNPFKIDANNDRDKVVMMFTDYLLKNQEMLRDMIKLTEMKSKVDDGPVKLGCWCAPSLCHGDVICWLLDNAIGDMKNLAHISSSQQEKEFQAGGAERPKSSQATQEEVLAKWRESGDRALVTTTSGLVLAKGYNTVIQDDWRKWWIEINDFDIMRNHIHQSLNDITNDDEDAPRKFFKSNDRTKVTVVQQNAGFADSPFKQGCWYIRVDNPIDNKPVTE